MNDVEIAMPDEGELERSRKQRKKEKKMLQVGRELITYIVFLFLLMTVCYGNRTEYGFLMTQDIKNTFSGFDKVRTTVSQKSLINKVDMVCLSPVGYGV